MRTVDLPSRGGARQRATGLTVLYGERVEEMVRLAWLLTSSRDAAHDISHDAFAEVHRRWDAIDDPVAYLRRCVINGANDFHRRRGRERTALDRVGRPPAAAAAGDEYLSDLIGTLPVRQQSVVVLRFWGGLTEQEIAAAVGCRPGSVGPLLHRALDRLRAALVVEPEEDRT